MTTVTYPSTPRSISSRGADSRDIIFSPRTRPSFTGDLFSSESSIFFSNYELNPSLSSPTPLQRRSLVPSSPSQLEQPSDTSLYREFMNNLGYRRDSLSLIHISKDIDKSEKEGLSYYYKNKDYNPDIHFAAIRDCFSTPEQKKALLTAIDTIRYLLKEGFISQPDMNFIKEKLSDKLLNGHGQTIHRKNISDFVDKIVNLSRYQPNYFFSPARTNSIKKLIEYFGLNAMSTGIFSDIQHTHTQQKENLFLKIRNFIKKTFWELVRIFSSRYTTLLKVRGRHEYYTEQAYVASNNLSSGVVQEFDDDNNSEVDYDNNSEVDYDNNSEVDYDNNSEVDYGSNSEDNPVDDLGNNYYPIDDLPTSHPKITAEQNDQINAQVQTAVLNKSQLSRILKKYHDISELIQEPASSEHIEEKDREIIINFDKSKGIIKCLKINLIELAVMENILESEKHSLFMFIVMRQGDTLILNPYTPESFHNTLNAIGLVEQTNRFPIVLENESSSENKNYPEKKWFILSRKKFRQILE